MDSFDKKISHLFNNDELPEVPQEFSWNSMNEEIYAKLEKEKKKKRPIFWYWVGSFAFLVFMGIGTWLYQADTASILKSSFVEKSIAQSESQSQKTKMTASSHSDLYYTSISENNTKKNTIKSFEKPRLKKSQDALISIESKLADNSTKHTNGLNKNENSEIEVQIKSHNPASISNLNRNVDVLLIYTPISNLDLPRKPLTIPNFASPNIPIEKETKTQKISFEPIIYGGSLLGFGGYQNAQIRSESSSWLPGYYTGFKLAMFEYSGFNIYAGFEHKFAVEKFDINSSFIKKDTLQNVLISVQTNALTGREYETYGTAVSSQSTSHKYINYNTFRVNTLKFGVTKSLKKGPLSLFLSGGIDYAFLSYSQGKTIGNQQNIIDYNSQNRLFRNTGWSIEGGLQLKYKLGKNVFLNAHITGETALSNWSIYENIYLSPQFLKIGGGIGYSF